MVVDQPLIYQELSNIIQAQNADRPFASPSTLSLIAGSSLPNYGIPDRRPGAPTTSVAVGRLRCCVHSRTVCDLTCDTAPQIALWLVSHAGIGKLCSGFVLLQAFVNLLLLVDLLSPYNYSVQVSLWHSCNSHADNKIETCWNHIFSMQNIDMTWH